ncbi:hypothetical protein PSPHG_CDS_0133 [Pseudomonas phage Psxphi15]
MCFLLLCLYVWLYHSKLSLRGKALKVLYRANGNTSSELNSCKRQTSVVFLMLHIRLFMLTFEAKENPLYGGLSSKASV